MSEQTDFLDMRGSALHVPSEAQHWPGPEPRRAG